MKKILNLTLNEIKKQMSKKTFKICFLIITAFAIIYPILIKEVTYWIDENTTMSSYVESLEDDINRSKEYAKEEENYDLYKDDYNEITNSLIEYANKFRDKKSTVSEKKIEYIGNAIEAEAQINLIDMYLEDESIKENLLINNYFYYGYIDDTLTKEELLKQKEDKIKEQQKYERIILNDDYNYVIEMYYEDATRELEDSKKILEDYKVFNKDKKETEEYKDTVKNYENEIIKNEYIYDFYKEAKAKDYSDKKYTFVFNYINSIENNISEYSDSLTLMSEEDFNSDSYSKEEFGTYKKYESYKELSQKTFLSEANKYKYAFLNKIDFEKMGSRYLIEDLVSASVIIGIFVIAISGGIVANEFNDGTIRLLLTRPCKRWKILLSKLLTVIFFSIFYMFIWCLLGSIISIILFGIKDLSIPYLIIKNFDVVELNYYVYLLREIGFKLIGIIFSGILALFLSTIINSTAFSTAVSMGFYIGGEIVIALFSLTKIVKYFAYTFIPFIHINNYVDSYSILEYSKMFQRLITPNYAILLLTIYAVIFLVIAFIVFNKKDIKN